MSEEALVRRSVIAGYDSFEQAQRAVRSLERHLSIQDMVIADENHRTWRRLRSKHDGRDAAGGAFLVVMTGEPRSIERARELLSETSPAP